MRKVSLFFTAFAFVLIFMFTAPKNSDAVSGSADLEANAVEKYGLSKIIPVGTYNTRAGEHFTGKSFLYPLSTQQVGVFNVTFEPGCYNEWHTHFASEGGGQILIAISGRGWYQEEGKPAQELNPGDVVNIPANVKHWHGAAKDSWFQHVALEVPGKDTHTEWHGFLSHDKYEKLK